MPLRLAALARLALQLAQHHAPVAAITLACGAAATPLVIALADSTRRDP